MTSSMTSKIFTIMVTLSVAVQAVPLPPSVTEFDPKKFGGRWFQHGLSEDQFKFQPKPECAAVNFELVNRLRDGSPAPSPWFRYKGVQQVAKNLGTQKLQRVFGNVTQLQTPNTPNHDPSAAAGELNVRFAPNSLFPGQPEFDAGERVLMVSESEGMYDFAILANGPKPEGFTTLFVLARQQYLKDEYATELDRFIQTTGFNVTVYRVPNGVRCYYDGPAGVAPPPLAQLDITKFSGRWYQHRIDAGQFAFQGGANSKCASNYFKVSTNKATNTKYIENLGSTQIGEVGKDQKLNVVISGVTPSQDGSGVITVFFPPGELFPNSPPITSKEWVIDVGDDGNTYSWHIATNGPQYSAIFLNTREPVLNDTILQHFNDYLEKTYFWQDVFDQPQPKDCAYADPAEYLVSQTTASPNNNGPSGTTTGVESWAVAIICLLCIAAGFGIGFFVKKIIQNRQMQSGKQYIMSTDGTDLSV